MPIIRVSVLREDEPASGHRVVLGFEDGNSTEEYTGSNGVAEFEVEYGQEGIVFVDGSNEGHWGSYSATDITVNL